MGDRKSDTLLLCKCQSYCTTLNRTTQRYEGRGQWVKKSIKSAHSRADRTRRLEASVDYSTPHFGFVVPNPLEQIWKETLWINDIATVSPQKPLVFTLHPALADLRDPEDIHHPSNAGLLELEGSSQCNASFLFAETRLQFLASLLAQEPLTDAREDVAGLVQDSLSQLLDLKVSEWQMQQVQVPGRLNVNTKSYFARKGPVSVESRTASVLCLVLQHMYHATRRALRVHLSGIRSVLSSAGAPSNIVQAIPQDPRTCARSFHIDGRFKHYLSCPSCHFLIPYQVSMSPEASETCSHRRTPSSEPCGAELWKVVTLSGGLSKHVPVRKYYHHDIKDWLGRLLVRPGIEDLLADTKICVPDDGKPIDDIWCSTVFLNLKDTSDQPFFPAPNGNCRLVFGLSVNGFIPYGSKKQSASSTGIWLVLLNLPPALRHLPQYLFLAGVIPGPDKPSKDAINHYIQLVVDDFLELWSPGVTFTPTYKFRGGRLVEAIIVPVVCDHPGLRQVIGYAGGSNSHNICTNCDIDIDDIHVTDRAHWPTKDSSQIRLFATMWKNARSEEHQEAIFNAFGWRWSPLFDLPYWDPVKFSVVDSMHCLDLNLFSNHCRSLFQIDLKHPGGDRASALLNPVARDQVLAPNNRDVRECRKVLKANEPTLLFQLLEFNRPVLFTLCSTFNVLGDAPIIIGSRHILAQNLHSWRLRLQDLSIFDEDSSRPHSDALGEIVDDGPINAECMLAGLEGEKSERYIAVLKSLLTKGSLETVQSARSDAYRQTHVVFYAQIIAAYPLPLPGRPTKHDYHTTICTGIDTDMNFRRFLEGQLDVASSERDIEDGTSDPGDADTDLDAEPDTFTEAPTLNPVGDLNGSKRERSKAVTVIRHLLSIGTPNEKVRAREKALVGPVSLYMDICSVLNISLPERSPKKALQAAILLAISGNAPQRRLLEDCLPDPKYDAVLGLDVMERVWEIMRNTVLPSWISPAPGNWGTAKRGTLSANNWRVICTIHLPVTLIWIWRDEAGRKQQLLRNFMDLVTAARLASLRKLSPEHIEAYTLHMTRYVEGIITLFPKYNLKPTHHTALHIGDIMNNFGPDHSHNALFYERHIRILGLLNTNNKSGEIESTFVRSSAQYSHLCAILEDNERLRRDMQEMIDKMESIRKEDLHGFQLASILDPHAAQYDLSANARAVELADDILSSLAVLQKSRGIPASRDDYLELPSLGLDGVRYAPVDSPHPRDSSVIFRADSQSVHSTGIIQQIFIQRSQETSHVYLIVDEHDTVTRAGGNDPFRPFGFAAGYLCRAAPSRRHVITASQVVGHFILAWLPGTDDFHALPFDRTMFSFDPDGAEDGQ